MRCVLGSLIIAYVWLPSLVIYLLAYGDDYIGRGALPCLCCLDVRMPDFPWYVWLGALVVSVGGLIFMGWTEEKNQKKQREEAQERENKIRDFQI